MLVIERIFEMVFLVFEQMNTQRKHCSFSCLVWSGEYDFLASYNEIKWEKKNATLNTV